MKKALILPVLLMLLLPLVAAYLVYPQTHLPPGFGVFPPLLVAPAPGFNFLVFVLIAIIELVILALYIFPQWFGFKPVAPQPRPLVANFPWWFWLGLVTMLFFLGLMWSRSLVFGNLIYYAFTPLWWGFIVTLDGIAYRLTGGYSLLAKRPMSVLISAIVSLVGWALFEYLDYFLLGNWYYPNSNMPQLSHRTIVWIFLIAYTTVWPAIFEWYVLLNACPKLVARYQNGPKIKLSGNLFIWLGLGLIFAMVFLPYPLFGALWVAPLLLFSGTLMRLNVWNPFTAIAQGNWAPALLMGMATVLNGIFWEMWNYGSAHPVMPVTNPNYWIYDVPYINVIHLFSEMPLLGYLGYMPFGILALVMYLWAAKLCGFNPELLPHNR